MTAPKLFISYSWSNAEHEQWVIELASNLLATGYGERLGALH